MSKKDKNPEVPVDPKKKVRMQFDDVRVYNGETITDENHVAEVEPHMVERWQKRGGVILGEQVDAQGNPADGEAGDSDLGGSHTNEDPPTPPNTDPDPDKVDGQGELGDDEEEVEEEVEEEDATTGQKKKTKKKKARR